MVRSLWTGATGMNAQQTAVDTIANNLANVNTTGYKAQDPEFKSLLYQTLQTKTTTANAERKPTTSQVGLGTRTSSLNQVFTQGSLLASESDTSFAISGKGFFAVKCPDGSTYYTRNGDFNWSLSNGGGLILCDAEGRPVQSTRGTNIELNSSYMASKVVVDAEGRVCYPDAQNNLQVVNNLQIGLYQFNNPGGLNREGDSIWSVTANSGQPINESTNNNVEKSVVRQGYLEGSNVSVADEMVNLIVSQRAYEMNSKVITTTDTMMDEANQLKR